MPSRVDQLCRFERIGLKWNPFRTVTSEEKREVYLADLYETIELADQVAFSDAPYTQIIARAGHGKSTFLAAIAAVLDDAGTRFKSHYLQPSLRTRVRVPEDDVRILILDEAERLTRRNLRQLVRWTSHGGRLIVSSHGDLSGVAADSRNPVTIRLTDVTSVGLRRYFDTRLRWAGSGEERFVLTPDGADWLLASSGGNLRVVAAVLYEFFQDVADAAARHSETTESQSMPFQVDSSRLEWLAAFAQRRAADEEAGNVPFSRLRLLAGVLREVTDKTCAWLSGRPSTPDPVEREFPIQR